MKRANFIGIDCENPYSSPEGVLVALRYTQKRIKIFFVDTTVEPPVYYDPDSLSLKVLDNDTEVLSGDYPTLISKEADGIYYIDAIGGTYDLTANAPKNFMFIWTYTNTAGGEVFTAVSNLYTIRQRTYDWFHMLRSQIDKSEKLYKDFIGYQDGNILMYLQGGLSEINLFPPVTGFTLVNYPETYSQLLVNSATVVALTSQKLFAVDTDVLAYSDQGFSYQQDHFSRLNTVLTELLALVRDDLSRLKMEFTQLGSITVQVVPYYPLAVLLKTSAPGTLFRNLFVGGGNV